MKKVLAILILLLILSGCKPSESITMIVPYGSPELSQLYMEESNDYMVDIVQGADPLISAFGSISHDVIFAPTHLGAKMYNSMPSYLLAASIIWGNYYIISNTTYTLEELSNKEVVVFGQNQTSDIIIRYITTTLNITPDFIYVDSVSTATSLFISDSNRIVMVAEPSLSLIKQSMPNVKVIDLQQAYLEITGKDSYPQSSVFIKSSLSKHIVEKIMGDLESSIALVNSKITETAELSVSLGMGMSQAVVESAIPLSNIRFVHAQDAQTDIVYYFEIIMSLNSALISSIPDESFYFGD
jgi:NitT/TauT family transport system substrate-binding protein